MTIMARAADGLRWRVAALTDVARRNLVSAAVPVVCKPVTVALRERIVAAMVAGANIADRCLQVAVGADHQQCANIVDITASMVPWAAADLPVEGAVRCMVAADMIAADMGTDSLAVAIIVDMAASTATLPRNLVAVVGTNMEHDWPGTTARKSAVRWDMVAKRAASHLGSIGWRSNSSRSSKKSRLEQQQ
jgi:hypothetical protein